MTLRSLAMADLVLLLTAAGLGASTLLGWIRHRAAGFPAATITTHVCLQVLSIGLWIGVIVTESLALAWVTFAVITAGQVVGDMLMSASFRLRHRDQARATYLAMASDVLSFRRPVPALHAIVGASAWFGMLAICLYATLTR